jgi:hypothetical protein
MSLSRGIGARQSSVEDQQLRWVELEVALLVIFFGALASRSKARATLLVPCRRPLSAAGVFIQPGRLPTSADRVV